MQNRNGINFRVNTYFKIEKKRDYYAKKGFFKKFIKLYSRGLPEIQNNNTPSFSSEKLATNWKESENSDIYQDKIRGVLDILSDKKGNLLDIGFGNNYLEKLLLKVKSPLRLHGVDISILAVKNAYELGFRAFRRGNIYKIPFKNSQFDFVLTLDILEHLSPSSIFDALAEVNRVMKESAQLVVTVPLNEGLEQMIITRNSNPNSHVRAYTPDILKNELRIAGFVPKFEKYLYAFEKFYYLKKLLINISPIKFRKPNLFLVSARKSTPKIAFDGRYLQGNLTGIGKYIKNLVQGLAAGGIECVIFCNSRPKFKIRNGRVKYVILKTKNTYYFEQVLLPLALNKEKVSLYHATANSGIPLLCNIPTVLTVHDIIPLDIKSYFAYSSFPLLHKASYLMRLITSCWKANKIITITKYTKNHISKKLHLPKNKIEVVYSGIEVRSGKGKLPFGLKKKEYILNHGGIDARKNLERLIEAFSLVHKKLPKIKLVITGENKELKVKLLKNVELLGLKNQVIFPGYVDEEKLWTLLRNCRLVCYPTLVEGFGSPVLEAFATGVPVVTSNTSSLPEVSRGGATLINPNDTMAIASALIRTKVNKSARKVAAEFKWEKTVQETLGIYKELLI